MHHGLFYCIFPLLETPCSFLPLNDAALQMHGLCVRMRTSVSPWLQEYDYATFSVSMVTSI